MDLDRPTSEFNSQINSCLAVSSSNQNNEDRSELLPSLIIWSIVMKLDFGMNTVIVCVALGVMGIGLSSSAMAQGRGGDPGGGHRSLLGEVRRRFTVVAV